MIERDSGNSGNRYMLENLISLPPLSLKLGLSERGRHER
jgi:hypothetical protein